MDLQDGQKLSILLVAHRDPQFSLIERALAAFAADALDVSRAPAPGLLVGQVLTAAGSAAVRSLLPPTSPSVFPFVVADVLRRLRGLGHMCSDVSVSAVDLSEYGRPGWRVSWEGEGWQWFSRQSDDSAGYRGELETAAQLLGLTIEAEPAPTLLVVEPARGEEDIIIKLETLDSEFSPLERVRVAVDKAFEEIDEDVEAYLASHGSSTRLFKEKLDRAYEQRKGVMLTFEQLMLELDSPAL